MVATVTDEQFAARALVRDWARKGGTAAIRGKFSAQDAQDPVDRRASCVRVTKRLVTSCGALQFFIGEVVDVTGQLGGYNFQWAWASGHAAGQVV